MQLHSTTHMWHDKNTVNRANCIKFWNCSSNRKSINSHWILVCIWDIFGNFLIKTRCKKVNNMLWKWNVLHVFWKSLEKTSIQCFHLVILKNNLHCYFLSLEHELLTAIHSYLYSKSTFPLLEYYMKILLSLQSHHISYSLS